VEADCKILVTCPNSLHCLRILADNEPLVPLLRARRAAKKAAEEEEQKKRRERLVQLVKTQDPRSRAGPRETSCLRCIRSALKGRSTGQCWETAGRGTRCFLCSRGYKCEPVPASLSLLARRLVAVICDPSSSKAVISNYRVTMKIMLGLIGEGEDGG
jgi:hypothetical protein